MRNVEKVFDFHLHDKLWVDKWRSYMQKKRILFFLF